MKKASLNQKGLIVESDKQGRMICLETSTLKNIPWYKKYGFGVYNEADLTYHLFS